MSADGAKPSPPDHLYRPVPGSARPRVAVLSVLVLEAVLLDQAAGAVTAARVHETFLRRCSSHLGPVENLIRISPGEFVMVCEPNASTVRIMELADDILGCAGEPITVNGYRVRLRLRLDVRYARGLVTEAALFASRERVLGDGVH